MFIREKSKKVNGKKIYIYSTSSLNLFVLLQGQDSK